MISDSKYTNIMYEYQDVTNAVLDEAYFKVYVYELREDEIVKIELSKFYGFPIDGFYYHFYLVCGIFGETLAYGLVQATLGVDIEKSKERIRELENLDKVKK